MKRMAKSVMLVSAFLLMGCVGAGAEEGVVQWDAGTGNRIHNVELADGNVSANGVRAKNVSASTVSGGYVYSHGGVIGDVKFGTDGTLTGIPDAGDLSKADPSAAVNVKTLQEAIAQLEARVAALEKENEELEIENSGLKGIRNKISKNRLAKRGLFPRLRRYLANRG